jgi:hypothetical protein
MADKPKEPGKPAKSTAKAAREARLATALRSNLKRRKAAALDAKAAAAQEHAQKEPEARAQKP